MSVRRRVGRLLVRLGWFAAGAIIVALFIVIRDSGRLPVELWHTELLTSEFTTDRSDEIRTFEDYLQLETRLFRYPLSYMVYSRAFDAIEPVVREYLLRRLFDVLIGDDVSDAFSNVTPSDRQEILAILRDTKPNLPAYWRTR